VHVAGGDVGSIGVEDLIPCFEDAVPFSSSWADVPWPLPGRRVGSWTPRSGACMGRLGAGTGSMHVGVGAGRSGAYGDAGSMSRLGGSSKSKYNKS
jgi:hypothetical protein